MPLRPALRDFAGELLLPGDPAFYDARRVQNDIVDPCPARVCEWDPDDLLSSRHAITTKDTT